MIYGFFPEPDILASGTGKTLMMVRAVWEKFHIEDKQKGIYREVLSNINLLDIPHKKISAEDFAPKQLKLKKYSNKIIVCDEMTQFIDARKSNSTKSLTIQENLILQNRHQTTDIFYTYQRYDMADKRLITATGYFFFCRPLDRTGEKATRFRVSVFSQIIGKFIYYFEFDGSEYFTKYDTAEKVGDNEDNED